MTRTEAYTLLDELRSVFPHSENRLDEQGIRRYVNSLQAMRLEQGREAVTTCIGTCRFLPTIAELEQSYQVAAEQYRRTVAAERTRLERLNEDNQIRPQLKDIPDAMNYLAKLHDADEQPHLEELDAGKCDDCLRDNVPRFKFARLALCTTCVVPRLRARAHVEAAS